jgi:hypothetical protein
MVSHGTAIPPAGGEFNAINTVALQYGHVLNSKLHDAAWCFYLKGGSAYWLVAGSAIYNCGEAAFAAGQGTGFEYMESPWLQYEAYDIKVVNNVVYNVTGGWLPEGLGAAVCCVTCAAAGLGLYWLYWLFCGISPDWVPCWQGCSCCCWPEVQHMPGALSRHCQHACCKEVSRCPHICKQHQPLHPRHHTCTPWHTCRCRPQRVWRLQHPDGPQHAVPSGPAQPPAGGAVRRPLMRRRHPGGGQLRHVPGPGGLGPHC